MENIGGWELILIVVVAVLFFGAKKIPEIAKGIGEGIREFKRASSDEAEHEARTPAGRLPKHTES